jgi:Domain of unknown function (DUF5667)
MKRFTQQFHKQSESVKIQAAEKRELRERVVSYMEYHPMPASLAQSVRPVKSLSISPYGMVQIPFSIVFKWSAVATVFLLVVLPVMAERSVPGDNLYAVKVRFSEEVRSTLTLTSYAKVEWETERINRRVAEARLLASEGRLTSEVEVEIAAAVKEHTEMVQHEIDELRESDVDQATLASIELSTTLELQSASLQDDGNATLALAISDVASGNSTQLVVDVINESLSANESQVESLLMTKLWLGWRLIPLERTSCLLLFPLHQMINCERTSAVGSKTSVAVLKSQKPCVARTKWWRVNILSMYCNAHKNSSYI